MVIDFKDVGTKDKVNLDQIARMLMGMDEKLKVLETTINERFEKLKDVLYNYIEMGSNINLGTVKAALKSV